MNNYWKYTGVLLLLISVVCGPVDTYGATKSKVRLSVKAKTEKDEARKEDDSENSSGSQITTTTDTKQEVCTLEVKVKNSGKETCKCQLEWYFLSENIGKETKGIFDFGKKELNLEAGEDLEDSIASKAFVIKKVASSNSNSDDKISGDKYEGYIVLVTQGKEILAEESNSSIYLKDEWIMRCKKAK